MKMKIPRFEQARVLVVGDVMLDRYWYGDVSRISPEAPVPVVHVLKTEDRIGGAGNVVHNISVLGGSAKLLGLVGNDELATIIEKKLEELQLEHCLMRLPGFSSISKLRVIGHNQQLIRLDFEQHFKDWDEKSFFSAYLSKLADVDLVIFSDYAKGTLSHVTKMIEHARKLGKKVVVDPKSKDLGIYRGATVITPNMSEFEAAVGSCANENEIEDKANAMLKRYEFEAILLTRGAGGMSLIRKDKPIVHIATEAQEIYDVTGAGDTVIATFGAALAAREDLLEAMLIANVAAGEVVKKLGTSTVSISELRRAVQRQQNFLYAILDEEKLLEYVKDARLHGEKIVMTNGCFDILHPGHAQYLEKAKSLGHRLVVAVNDDNSVSSLKGDKRPVNKLKDRMLMLAALNSVDWVVSFSEDTPERIISTVSPDVLVKGGDYEADSIVGSGHVRSYGGEVVIVPFEEGYSTTSILDRINTKKAPG